jgi:transcriptional regulator with XRE-family HTH domain
MPTDNSRMAWNDKLRLALMARGVGAPQLAPLLDVQDNTARNYLSARTHPSIDVFWRICQIAGVSADWVLDDEQPARLVPATQEASGPVIIRERTLPPPRPSVRKANAHGKRAEAPTAEPPPKRKRPASPSRRRGDK